MKWTKEPPTEPGWYWWRDDASKKILPMEILKVGGIPCINLIGLYAAKDSHGQWWPIKIEPPEDSE